ncbi:hypothetical protein F5Y17DRAFT_444410 [Xylariaceae sp. FL0594]|nr:hypothetical protein F5Y17DRAFT_444410 [Xylariaceae sp. FL0594]
MAWATSFSRPTKSDAIPPPYYLLSQFQDNPAAPYCEGCGKLTNPKRTFGFTGAPVSTATNQKQAAGKTKGSRRGVKGDESEAEYDKVAEKRGQNEVNKFCTSRCRSESHHKRRDVLEREKEIEETYIKLLNGVVDPIAVGQADGKKREKNGGAKLKKGEGRVVTLDEVEAIVFGREDDPEKVYGRKKNRKSRALTSLGGNEEDHHPVEEETSSASVTSEAETPESRRDDRPNLNTVDLSQVDNEAVNGRLPKGKPHPYTTGGHEVARLAVRSGTRIRPPQEVSEVNGSVGGEKGRAERKAQSEEEKEEIRQKKLEGDKRAHQRDMIKAVARRGVVFGFDVSAASDSDGKKMLCECVIPGGKVVEPHFAKGNWGIRWRVL